MIKQPMILVAKMLELVKKLQVIVVEIILKYMELLEMINCKIVELMEKQQ